MTEATYTPVWYNPDLPWIAQGQAVAPPLVIPDNKLLYAVNKHTALSSNSMIGNGGIRAFMDTAASDDNRLNWNHSNVFGNAGKGPGSGYGSSSLSQQDVYNVAATIPLAFAEADEMAEGDPWATPFDKDQYRWFLEARKAMYDAQGKTMRHYGTYGSGSVQNGEPWEFTTGDGSQKAPNDPAFKATLQNQAAARKRPFSGNPVEYFSMFAPLGIGAIIKHYCDRPDYASRYYNKKYAAQQMNLGMGAPWGLPSDKLIYLDWGKIEGLGPENASLHNGFYYKRVVSNLGVVSYEMHPQIDFWYQVGCIFGIGFCETSGYIAFDDRIRYGTNPLLTRNNLESFGSSYGHSWTPINGAAEPASPEGYPIEPCGWHDAGMFAAALYAQTAPTAGQAWEPCEYKVKGTENWITPTSDHTDILEHASANGGAYAQGSGSAGRRGRQDCMKRVKGNNITYWVFDPSWGPKNKETIIMRPVPNKVYEVEVTGCRMRLFNDTI